MYLMSTANFPRDNVILTMLYFFFLQARDLLKAFMIPAKTFVTFMMTLEDNYLKDNPFHNSTHAADVTQSTNVLLNSPALEVSYLTACIILILSQYVSIPW